MLIPLGTEISTRRRPIVTEAFIIVNLLVYLAGLIGEATGSFESRAVLAQWGHFDPQNFKVWQLLTYQFLHDPDGVFHIAFNLLFLWVFGQAVENRFGHLGFAAFYILGGATAGLVHAVFSIHPVIGASGSIAAVSGAFLALFPRSHIRVLVFFFIIGVYSIPALWFIGIYFVIDLINATTDMMGRQGSGVAYGAHLGGYLFGFGLAMGLLALRIVPRGEFDMVRLWQQARRRAKFRALTQHQVAGPWESASADTQQKLEQARTKAKAKEENAPWRQEGDAAVSLRVKISAQLADHDIPAAAESYRQLRRLEPEAMLPEPQQLDVANQLFAEADHAQASKAYEAMLKRYPNSPHSDEVRLMLGVIYSRHIRKPDRARDLILKVRQNLRDAAQRALADQLLAELGT
jgi:membrane associated rhomboid family serine protease